MLVRTDLARVLFTQVEGAGAAEEGWHVPALRVTLPLLGPHALPDQELGTGPSPAAV